MVHTRRKSGAVTENDRAYIAGLFDGEGSITYKKYKTKKREKYYKCWVIEATMEMTDKYVMEWLHKTLNFGTLNERKKLRPGRKRIWRWRCKHRDALVFAKLLWPYAQVKLHKLEMIIDHYDPEYNTENVVALEDYR